MIYGMEDDNDEFALVAKPKLNTKKIYLIAGISIAVLVFMFVFFFSGINNENTSGENYALNSGEEVESNPILAMPDENNEEVPEEYFNEESPEPQVQKVRFYRASRT